MIRINFDTFLESIKNSDIETLAYKTEEMSNLLHNISPSNKSWEGNILHIETDQPELFGQNQIWIETDLPMHVMKTSYLDLSESDIYYDHIKNQNMDNVLVNSDISDISDILEEYGELDSSDYDD